TRRRDDVRGAQCRRQFFVRADRQRDRRGGGDADTGGDGVSDCDAPVSLAVLSSSTAWRRAVAMSRSPSMRAISLTRSSPCTTATSLVAMPPFLPLATTSC